MIDPVPCLLVIEKDGTINLYDVRRPHPRALVMSLHIKNPKGAATGFAMVSFYGHLRQKWLSRLRRQFIRVLRKMGKDLVDVGDPRRYLDEWERRRAEVFDG